MSLAVITNRLNESENTLQKMYELAWKYGLLDFNVLIPNDTNSQWKLLTYLPFQSDCIALEPKHISTFTYDNYTRDLNVTFNQLYPPKNRKFNKCPITVATYHVEPYVRVHVVKGRSQPVFDGIEVTMINNIAAAINLTVIYKDAESRGDVYDNGTLTGSVKWVS